MGKMPKECVYFLGGQVTGGYRELNKSRLWLVEIKIPSFCSEKKNLETANKVEISKSLNWKPSL